MCGSMDGQEKTRIVNGKVDQIMAISSQTLFVSQNNYILRYWYGWGVMEIQQIIHEENFFYMEWLDLRRLNQNFNVITKKRLYDDRLILFADIALIDKNSLIGFQYMFDRFIPSQLYLQYVHHFSEDLKFVKILNETDRHEGNY